MNPSQPTNQTTPPYRKKTVMLKIFTSNECIFPLLSFISINIVGSKTLFRTLKKTYSMVYQQQGDNHTQVKYLIVKQESICSILYYSNISPPPPTPTHTQWVPCTFNINSVSFWNKHKYQKNWHHIISM